MNFFKNRPLASCCFAFIAVYFLLFYIPSFAKLVVAVAAITVGILFF